jgi:acetyl esterase/lipase
LLRAGTAILLVAMGALTVIRVPHGALWKPAVGATTMGYLLLPLAVVVTWSGDDFDAAGRTALFGAALLCTPWMRALASIGGIRSAVVRRFGDTPWTGGLAPARHGPLTLGGLLGTRAARHAPTRHVFDAVHGLGLEVYAGAGPGPHPVVLAIHGGSWNSGEPSQLPGVYHWLAARGITVAAMAYRFAPAHAFPAQHDDTRAALTWLVHHAEPLGIDPDQIVLYGRSAGGQLALLTGLDHPGAPIRGVVALYAPSDMVWSWHHPCNPRVMDSPTLLGEYMGGTIDEVPDRYEAASPIRFVDGQDPPVLMFHGSRDALVYAEQSRRMSKALAQQGVPNLLVETSWDIHGLDANLAGPGGQILLWTLERFLSHVLKPAAPHES